MVGTCGKKDRGRCSNENVELPYLAKTNVTSSFTIHFLKKGLMLVNQ